MCVGKLKILLGALLMSGKDVGSLICNVGSGVAAGGGGAAAGGAEQAEAKEEKKEEKKEESEEESDDDMGFGECLTFALRMAVLIVSIIEQISLETKQGLLSCSYHDACSIVN